MEHFVKRPKILKTFLRAEVGRREFQFDASWALHSRFFATLRVLTKLFR